MIMFCLLEYKPNKVYFKILVACEPLKEVRDWTNIPQGMEVIRRQGEEEVSYLTF